MTRPRFLGGVLLASTLIGPLTVVATTLLSVSSARDLSELWSIPFAVIAALPLGFAVSLLPNLAGSALLAWAGRGNLGLRLPPVWAMAGAAGGWGIGALWTPIAETQGVAAGIGAVSALLCRSMTRWQD